MDHTEQLTRYTAQFVDELVRSGVKNVVISPGSRSTPMAMLMCEHRCIKEWILIDERSAAFFALGMAKEKQQPVALICTSGTAAANYFPAIIEAFYSYVPLIVLTADRPHELRDTGAPQAIEQVNLYGNYQKWFHDMALPEATPEMLTYARKQASRAVQVAQMDNPGPVHINFPFREPLIPDLTLDNLWGHTRAPKHKLSYTGKPCLEQEQLQAFRETITTYKRGLIICGPQADPSLAEVVVSLAEFLHIPILADPLSHVRSGSHHKAVVIENYDAMLRSDAIQSQIKADYVIRFGAMPVSKSLRLYLEAHHELEHFIVEPYASFRNPTDQTVSYIHADPSLFCQELIQTIGNQMSNDTWLNKWQAMNTLAKAALSQSDDMLTEGTATQALFKEIPHQSTLFVGNSMAIRDVDTFFMSTDKNLKVLANRGANGIDGVVSSSLGAAAGMGNRVTLLIGDLSFYHDLNGLLAAKHYQLNLTVVLINNNGGGIFSFLPQAREEQHFDTLFGTPLHINFEHAVTMYDGTYRLVETLAAFREELKASYLTAGLTVIEIQTDRTENAAWHRALWQSMEQSILSQAGETDAVYD